MLDSLQGLDAEKIDLLEDKIETMNLLLGNVTHQRDNLSISLSLSDKQRALVEIELKVARRKLKNLKRATIFGGGLAIVLLILIII